MAIVPIVFDSITNTHRPATDGESLMLSQEADNYLHYGRDRGIYVSGNDILSNGSENLLVIDGNDKRITLTRAQLTNAGFLSGSIGDLVSSKAGNLLTISTTDQKLYVSAGDLSSSGFVTLSEVQRLISTDVANAIKRGTDGLLYAPLDCGEIA